MSLLSDADNYADSNLKTLFYSALLLFEYSI